METRTYEREKLYKEIWAEPMTAKGKEDLIFATKI